MNVVDSSGWLEYLADGANAEFFASAIEATEMLIVPAISLYEVFKKLLLERGEQDALRAVAQMFQGRVVELDAALALEGARISAVLKLPMADSIILATARAHQATLWTQDVDFEGIEGVEYIAKPKS